jgi:hypothetical protein
MLDWRRIRGIDWAVIAAVLFQLALLLFRGGRLTQQVDDCAARLDRIEQRLNSVLNHR